MCQVCDEKSNSTEVSFLRCVVIGLCLGVLFGLPLIISGS